LHSVQCVYAFCDNIAIHSNYFPIQHRAVGLYKGKPLSLCEYLCKRRFVLVFRVLSTAITVLVTTISCLAIVFMQKIDAVSERIALALAGSDFHNSFTRAGKLAKYFRGFSQPCKRILFIIPRVTTCLSYFVFPRSNSPVILLCD